ncbi:MAG: RNA-directed DNA polymerase [Gammaproteobacteria bacterium]|nr:RNA-directed DNA polymerase [Gammaproteobacteria bacterium]MCW8840187.1 RNA-directed DNA polymerase [Gammaproteobacteria bacterium]MCW8959446.1 RNA-directed DNA polymerase [Gammaproteobacteria bacterium]
MGYQAEFTGWNNITLEDLVVAYRKAKADCFFENTFPTAIKFAEYEQELLANLKALLKRLHDDQGFAENNDLLGDFRILPKKLSLKSKSDAPTNGHVHFSNSDRAVEHLLHHHDIIPDFRIVGDFPVDSHILSALWVNMVGHKFDARLDDNCYGARLRRIRNDELFSDQTNRPFHISAIGSFVPYFQPYQKWRNDGLKAIRGEIEKERDIIAVSLDLKSYYHFIDPMALASQTLCEELGLGLTNEEQAITEEFAKFLSRWSEGASKFSKRIIKGKANMPGGLVIGLTASRIISNVLLHRWDRLIKEKIAPIHYGRYVDDMFLVLRDIGTIRNSHDFMRFLQDRLGADVIAEVGGDDDRLWQIQQGGEVQGKSLIKLQSDKQKLFVLQGRAGLDLLDSIEKEIAGLSSEHRLMPSPEQLEDSTAARVLSAAGTVGESADTLRRADGLTIRRLSWSLQLRHVETLARDLPPKEWNEQRQEFYQFAHNHILRPDNLFAHFSYLPRLLGFAISLNEWQQAEQIALRAYHSLEQLATAVPKDAEVSINGTKAKAGKDLWRLVKGTLTWLFIDAATRYYDPNQLLLGQRSKKEQRLADLFMNGIFDSLVEVENLLDFRFGSEDFDKKAPLVALADLAKAPYKRILRNRSSTQLIEKREGKKGASVLKLLESSDLLNVEALKDFLKSTRSSRLKAVQSGARKKESYLPYLFPTRPLTPAEISELAPECVGLRRTDGIICEEKPSVIWAKYTQALRGVWIKPTLLATKQDHEERTKPKNTRKYIRIGTDIKHEITIALTNLKTEDKDWAATACNKPNLSRERYQRISDLVKQTITLKPRPDYVLFPELSIPLHWVDSLAAPLNAAGISLIAGTEYRHFYNDQILSEVCLVLADNRLGYPATVKIWQPKLEPAVSEDKELTSKYGKVWAFSRLRGKRTKPIYVHNNVHFGVMVCSELQNSKARVKFQGEVDALMALSWNKDLETFASLIESAALDVHAYTILVNNRKYGDSRVRSPAKESFMRDIARVRGGDNDFVVAATLDIDALRAFQSRAKRWPEEADKFKPLPEGFKLGKGRRKLPPK